MIKEKANREVTMTIAFKKCVNKQYRIIAEMPALTVRVAERRVSLAQKNFIRSFRTKLEELKLTPYERTKSEKLCRLAFSEVNKKLDGKVIIRTRKHSRYFISFDRVISPYTETN